MTKNERNAIVERVKEIREISFKISDAFIKAQSAQSIGKIKDLPKIDDVKKLAKEMQSLATTVNNLISNETTMEAK